MSLPIKPAVFLFSIDGMTLDTIDCFNCLSDMNMFYFYANAVSLNSCIIKNINMNTIYDDNGKQVYKSYSRIFKLFVKDSSYANGEDLDFFTNSVFENISGDQGSVAYLGSYIGEAKLTLNIKQTSFTNIYSETNGGLLLV